MASERSPHRSFFGSIHRTLLCDSIGVCQHLPRILLIFHFPKNTSLFLYPSASHPSATVGYAHHSTSMPRDGTIRPEKKTLVCNPHPHQRPSARVIGASVWGVGCPRGITSPCPSRRVLGRATGEDGIETFYFFLTIKCCFCF